MTSGPSPSGRSGPSTATSATWCGPMPTFGPWAPRGCSRSRKPPCEKSGSRYGYPPLREVIIRTQQYDLPVENVLVTSGTQHSNFLALMVALREGDEAIVEIPSGEQPRVLCEALNVNAKIIRRRSELG